MGFILYFAQLDPSVCVYCLSIFCLCVCVCVCVLQVVWGAIRRPWGHTVSAVRGLPVGPQSQDLPQDRPLDSTLQRHHADSVALLQQCFLRCVKQRWNPLVYLYTNHIQDTTETNILYIYIQWGNISMNKNTENISSRCLVDPPLRIMKLVSCCAWVSLLFWGEGLIVTHWETHEESVRLENWYAAERNL